MADAEIDAKPVDQDALVADIDRTRAELARTIDAISDRVSPAKNAQRAMEQVRQRASRAGGHFGRAISNSCWSFIASIGSPETRSLPWK